MWSVTGAMPIPLLTSAVTMSAVNGRAAEGISALPSTVPNTVWYALNGQSRPT